MKKQLTTIINLFFLLLAIGFTSCDKENEEISLFEVSFDTNEGSTVAPQLVVAGDTLIKPTDPTLEGSEFVAWTKADSPYDFSQAVTEDFTLVATWEKLVITHDVTFVLNNGEDDIVVAVIENEIVSASEEEPTLEGYEFTGWYSNDELFDFSTPITNPISIEARYTRSIGETEVVYQTISQDDFNALESQKHVLVKAQLNFFMRAWAWGTEAYLVDEEGNSSKDLYGHSDFGAFSFPIVFTKDDGHFDGQTFVFDIVKDIYMSSPQLGFAYGRDETFDDSGVKAYENWTWNAPMRYGIEYFNEAIRGNVREVNYDATEGVTVLVGETQIHIKALGTTEGEYENVSEDYVSQIEAMLGNNKYVRTIEVEGQTISVLKGNELQFTDTI